MATAYNQRDQIAQGWDNEAGLKTLDELDPCMFQWTDDGIPVQWEGWEALELDGNRKPVKIGLPKIIWNFPYITQEEIQALRALGPEVTIRTFDRDQNEWHNYNATMMPTLLAQSSNNRLEEYEYTIEFIDLRELP